MKRLEYMNPGNYRYRKPNNKFQYFEIRYCLQCGEPFITDKYNKVVYCPICKRGMMGRPVLTVLSDYSRKKISDSRTDQKHSERTKEKISKSIEDNYNSENGKKTRIELSEAHKGEKHHNYKHGETNTRLYIIWKGMKSRCSNFNNKSYDRYGGRGITYCVEWEKYVPFRDWSLSHGYDKRLQLDRIDNDSNYEPDNCQFLTPAEHTYKTFWIDWKNNPISTRLV